MRYKNPQSIQVVVFADGHGKRDYLLLQRVETEGGFWQSVTGSLEGCETHAQAAVREIAEEIGIAISENDLIPLNLVNTFEIAPLWRSKYAPGVTTNEEVCFALRVDTRKVRLNPNEHTGYAWVEYETAISMLYWESSKRAFAATERLLE